MAGEKGQASRWSRSGKQVAGGSRSGKQVAGEEGQVVRLQVQVVAKSRCQVKLNRREGER